MGSPTEQVEVPQAQPKDAPQHDPADLVRQIQAQARQDAMAAAAPESASQRMLDVTALGIKKIPQGFVNSLDPNYIIPNVALGFAIGAGTRLLLPAGGPVTKVAMTAMAGYFLGKPLVDTYSMAYDAKTMGDMQNAASLFGDTVGGLPVMMVEGGIGAKLGSGLAGKVLSTKAATPFVDWKANQYNKLENGIDIGVAGARNFAYNRFNIGGPVLTAGSLRSGIVPPYVLEELAAKQPRNPDFIDTLNKTNAALSTRRGIGQQGVAEQQGTGAREIYDAKGQEAVGTKVRSEGQPKTGNAEVDAIYEYSGDVRGFYKDVHGRNSIDGKGMPLESTVNYGQNYENAFWDGSRMTFGRPGPQSPFKTFVLRDISAHEMTHGVTEYTAKTVYRGQPGALNESFSDVWGALVEQRARGQKANEATWLVGDGIWKPEVKGRALRDMKNPGTAYDDVAVGKDPQPAHMKDFIRTRSDNGGVHLNSGIPNRAFVLFSEKVGGFAWESPAKIWYEARANSGSQPSFAQFAYQTIEAAKKLGYTAEVAKLEQAWGEVGVKPSAIDRGLPMAPVGGLSPWIIMPGSDGSQGR